MHSPNFIPGPPRSLLARRPVARRRPLHALACLAGAAFALAACAADTSMTRNFGGGGAQPEDVRAGIRPPLSLPPEFTLRPDRPGVTRVAQPSAAQAHAAAAGTGRVSAGQTALLDAAGPAATSDIRAKVNADVQLETPDQGFTDQLMGWQRPADQSPIIQRGSSKGLFGRIF